VKAYAVRVSETIDHMYIIHAYSKDDALFQFASLTDEELKKQDVDGNSSWDSPWNIEEI
jgi:hypothetical protein